MAVGQVIPSKPVLTLEELVAVQLVLGIHIFALARCVKERDRTSKNA